MSFEILHRDTKAVLYASAIAPDLRAAVVEAVKNGADLRGADLRGADLRGADLRGADLGGAYLRGADLRGADLRGAYLGGAYLGGAYLGGAYLGGAYLRGAYLGGAYLGGAYLGGAYGLLPNGLAPLQIGGTQHWIIVKQPGYITIGCEHHEVSWWEEYYEAVGRQENYSAEQIAEYRAHIEHCRAWMQRYGVLETPTATNASEEQPATGGRQGGPEA